MIEIKSVFQFHNASVPRNIIIRCGDMHLLPIKTSPAATSPASASPAATPIATLPVADEEVNQGSAIDTHDKNTTLTRQITTVPISLSRHTNF